MKKDEFINLDDAFNSNNHISAIIKKADKLNNLNGVILGMLDKKLAENTKVANYKRGVLTLATNSPASATQLRFTVPQLLKHLRESCNWQTLAEIRIKVSPEKKIYTPQKTKPIERNLSEQNAQLLSSLAKYVECPKLKQSLLKLSNLADK